MYAVSFYSFKGGVGRTMALVNTALALAQSGRRVMLIDFDLEAPGLTTFDWLRPDCPRPGIVEFVSHYLRTGTTPELDEYVYEVAGPESASGKAWVLPAGREDTAYRRSLAQINWIDLYRDKQGLLLFEDMKAQIETKYRPDYVFIDSRTGHSDVEGICTRHLPDAVVILFFPNEQNLSGLENVCRNIRAERETGLKKNITLHFVMSNVPDLDDEDAILRKRIREFQKCLEFETLTATIHHYNSLTLLNQSVFVLDRPASRLAKQYRRLLEKIVKGNLSDKEAALGFLKQVLSPEHAVQGDELGANWLQDTEKKIWTIAENFPDDGQVGFAVAKSLIALGHVREAANRLEKLLDITPDFVEARIERATSLSKLGDTRGAVQDLMLCVTSPTITEWQAISAIRLLSSLDIAKFSDVAISPTAISLSPRAKFIIAEDAMHNPRSWSLQDVRQSLITVLRHANSESKDDPFNEFQTSVLLTVLLIHEGLWDEAIGSIAPAGGVCVRVEEPFNLAMAHWGKSKVIPADLMRRAYETICEEEDRLDANFHQCSAIAAWAIGEEGQAINHLDAAEHLARNRAETIFSCWRYAYVTSNDFLNDCRSMRSMFQGGKDIPLFIGKHRAR